VFHLALTHSEVWASNLAYFGASTCFNLGCLITEVRSFASIIR
jgi:hypothetical protein